VLLSVKGQRRHETPGFHIKPLVATAVYVPVSWLWQQWRYRRKLGPYSGRFQAQWKYQDKTEPGTLVIKVHRNRLLVDVSDIEHPYHGKIVIDERFLDGGRGRYRQVKGDKVLWGLWDVQLLDRKTILVDRTYTHYAKMEPVVTAFVWERLPDAG
jgi:hypothetical protein